MRVRVRLFGFVVLIGAFAVGNFVFGDVVPHSLFSNNAVLQHGVKVPVWGTGAEGEKVTVEFRDQVANATVENGKWTAYLNDLKPGGPHSLIITGNNRIEVQNVAVGDVWLCAGQANMAMNLVKTDEGSTVVRHAKDPLFRYYQTPFDISEDPVADGQGVWDPCSPKKAHYFSGIGYYFAQELRETQDIPIGIIAGFMHTSSIVAWIPQGATEGKPEYQPYYFRYERAGKLYPEQREAYQKELEQFIAERKKSSGKAALLKLLARNPSLQNRPRKPTAPRRLMPGGVYNGVIAPLNPYAIKGVIWYQGSADTAYPELYQKAFPDLIHAWRWRWNQGDLPFLFVQLQGFGGFPEIDSSFSVSLASPGRHRTLGVLVAPNQYESPRLNRNWPFFREAQAQALALDHTAMVCAIDLGEETQIHPKKKKEIGVRLALAARAVVYGESIVFSGPVYDSKEIREGAIVLRFKHIGGGLVCRGEGLRGFTISGDDGLFVPAKARIDDDRVIVSSDDVEHPVHVRYGWTGYPQCNLYNIEYLPAVPFRTDNFPRPEYVDTLESKNEPTPSPARSLTDATTAPLSR